MLIDLQFVTHAREGGYLFERTIMGKADFDLEGEEPGYPVACDPLGPYAQRENRLQRSSPAGEHSESGLHSVLEDGPFWHWCFF